MQQAAGNHPCTPVYEKDIDYLQRLLLLGLPIPQSQVRYTISGWVLGMNLTWYDYESMPMGYNNLAFFFCR
jgi:hypothetical protein